MPWQCPACSAGIRYTDYDHVLRGRPYFCPGCGLALVIDRALDNLILAPATTSLNKHAPARATSAAASARPVGRRRVSDR
jgi:hypothetical protein